MLGFPRSHCKTHFVPKNICPYASDPDVLVLDEECAKVAADYLSTADLVFGDMILFESHMGFRDDGKAIWDGEKIIDLSFEPDDYGTIPPQFEVFNGVPVNYWFDLGHEERFLESECMKWGITHNKIINIDKNILPQNPRINNIILYESSSRVEIDYFEFGGYWFGIDLDEYDSIDLEGCYFEVCYDYDTEFPLILIQH